MRLKKMTHGNVVLNFRGLAESEFCSYGDAFWRAAQSLVENWQDHRCYWDTDACPVIYTYRHTIELFLKHINFTGAKCLTALGKELPRKHKTNIHEISKLFEDAKNILIKLEAWELDEVYEQQLLSRIDEMVRLDDNSYTFRYPTKKNGDATLSSHFKLNIFEFAQQADKLCKSLCGCCMMLEGILDNINDMARMVREEGY
jgi:hypothetical protein